MPHYFEAGGYRALSRDWVGSLRGALAEATLSTAVLLLTDDLDDLHEADHASAEGITAAARDAHLMRLMIVDACANLDNERGARHSLAEFASLVVHVRMGRKGELRERKPYYFHRQYCIELDSVGSNSNTALARAFIAPNLWHHRVNSNLTANDKVERFEHDERLEQLSLFDQIDAAQSPATAMQATYELNGSNMLSSGFMHPFWNLRLLMI